MEENQSEMLPEVAAYFEDRWELLKASPHPLVKWIAMNAEDYKYEAAPFLRAIRPNTTIADLQAVAYEKGYDSEIFDDLMRRASADGAIPA